MAGTPDIEQARPTRIWMTMTVGGVVLILVVAVAWSFGIRPSTFARRSNAAVAAATQLPNPTHDPLIDFVSATLTSLDRTWRSLLADSNISYVAPTVQLFDDSIPAVCGMSLPATGLFYCAPSRTVYIDLNFLRLLGRQTQGASPDAAQAYAIAHEVGHHVQTLLGDTERVRMQEESAPADAADRWQLRLELQADCFAGLWARHADDAPRSLVAGDIDAILAAASSVGRDSAKQHAADRMLLDPFTHGTSAQRERWFRLGLKADTPQGCDAYHSQAL
ncbi:MAG TPA: neutral zinc metallopeptidase [Pseudomonadales bacterium]|nr:neutral zinc metallopeptidase [Pseudomonadales bacterium]